VLTQKAAAALSTFGGLGNVPFAPGTWGSLVAIPIGWVVIEEFGNISLLLIALGVFIIGVWASGQFAKNRKNADPSSCIIDEVAGQLTALSFFANDPALMLSAFLTFRFFDIIKIWPTNWVDENIKGGFGIMIDDIVAAAQSIVVIKFALFFLH
tara:strand:+ start:190 stop:651 length:462 start_codon:yes stop_codon:yes gene_type:complete